MLSQRRRRLLAALHHRRGREKHGLFLVEGPRLVREALNTHHALSEVFVDPRAGSPEVAELAAELNAREIPVVEVSARELAELGDAVSPQGIVATAALATATMDAWRPVHPEPVLVVAGVQEPGNVGALLRTAEAYGLSTVLLALGTADPFNPKAVRGAMGAHFRLRLIREMEPEALVIGLRERGFCLLASVSHGGAELEREPRPDRSWALLVGGEGAGLARIYVESADRCLTIHTPGRAESLNVVVATGVLLDRLCSSGG